MKAWRTPRNSTGRWVTRPTTPAPATSRRIKSALRFLLLEELSDAHQIVGQHRGAHQHLEPLAALGPAPLHSATAKQHGDPALNADPESLSFLECSAALQCFLLGGLLSAPLR